MASSCDRGLSIRSSDDDDAGPAEVSGCPRAPSRGSGSHPPARDSADCRPPVGSRLERTQARLNERPESRPINGGIVELQRQVVRCWKIHEKAYQLRELPSQKRSPYFAESRPITALLNKSNLNAQLAFGSPRSPDHVAVRHPEAGHHVQDLASDRCLDSLRGQASGTHRRSENGLEARERSLHLAAFAEA